MLNDITFLPTRIATGQPMRIVDGTGTEICNVEGAVWITQAGDPRDIVLAAGERFRLDRGGLTLVVALNRPAKVRILAGEDRAVFEQLVVAGVVGAEGCGCAPVSEPFNLAA